MRRWLIVVCVLALASPAAGADDGLRFDGVRRIVAFADVHGAYPELLSVLRETGVVDEALHWRAGDTHLVSLGDLVDRGPGSRQVLDLLMRLETEARAAGGAVHVVLGNHEVMNIAGDLRYVSAAEYAAYAGPEDDALRASAWQRILAQEPGASAADFDAAFPRGWFARRQAFSPDGRFGRWLLARPFLIVVNDTAFVHGGLSPMVARLGLEGTNQALREQLTNYLRTWSTIESELSLARPVEFFDRPDALAARGAEQPSKALRDLEGAEVFTPSGPTWYRGQALCYPDVEAENLDAALAKLAVRRAVAGHTVSPTGRVQSRFDGRFILLDTGMLQAVYGGSPAAFVFENGGWSVAYANRAGERAQPEPPRRAVGPRPAGLDDDALERWLAEAEVVAVEDIGTGITKPQRVTLRKDGLTLRAVFKQLSTDFGTAGPRQSLDDADRFEYELAAYRLDRLLQLDMVPVAVPRTIEGHRGILQFWIEDAVTLQQVTERKLQSSGWCETNPQYNLMNVFDVLIHNTDRHQGNALFTKDWALVLIDHTRAFPTYVKRPRLLYLGELALPPALAARLEALDRQQLQQALGAWLKGRQIDAILKRRDLLLREHRARLAALPRAAGQ